MNIKTRRSGRKHKVFGAIKNQRFRRLLHKQNVETKNWAFFYKNEEID